MAHKHTDSSRSSHRHKPVLLQRPHRPDLHRRGPLPGHVRSRRQKVKLPTVLDILDNAWSYLVYNLKFLPHSMKPGSGRRVAEYSKVLTLTSFPDIRGARFPQAATRSKPASRGIELLELG